MNRPIIKSTITFALLSFGLATSGYAGLDKKDNAKLLEKAKNLCTEIKEFAEKEKDVRLGEAYERHCVKPAEPQLSALIGAFYHMNIDLKDSDKKKSEFYKSKLLEIIATTKWLPDFQTPPVKWDLKGAIFEMSGFAYDWRTKRLWTLGDSGTGPFIAYLETDTGKSHRIKVLNAKNIDWEAIVSEDPNHILILDVGDNHKERSSVTIYRADTREIKKNSIKVEGFGITYPEGPMDCEAAIVKNGTLYLFEKTYYLEPRVYTVDLNAKPLTAKLKGKLPQSPLLTDANLFDGRLFFLTYTGVAELENWQDLSKAKFRDVMSGQFGQVESIHALSPKQFWIGREDGKVFELTAP